MFLPDPLEIKQRVGVGVSLEDPPEEGTTGAKNNLIFPLLCDYM